MDCISIQLLAPAGFASCANEPAGRYERGYGLMLLSRKPLRDTRISDYNVQNQFRGYLQATVRDCRHSHSDFLLLFFRWTILGLSFVLT